MSNSPPPPSSHSAAPEFSGAALLCLLAMLNHVALTGGRITVSLTALQMGLSTFKVGTLVAVFAVLPMLFSVRAGRWVDRVGIVRPLVTGTTLVAVGTALPFLSQTQFALLVASCCIGIGFMLHQVATQDLLGHAEPAQRLRNFSLMSLALAGSGFSGPLIAGLAIYGGVPREEMGSFIRQVARIDAQVLQRRRVPAGERVGYGGTYLCTASTELAILNIGYADGYLRAFSGRGYALAGNVPLPVVGRVSMDLIAVRVDDAPEVAEGDWLEIAFDLRWASQTSGISQYELLTTLGRRYLRRWI